MTKERLVNEIRALDFSKESIMTCYRGSIAHGTYIPNDDPNSIDDIDFMSVVIPDIEHYYGLKSFGSRGTREIKQNELDIVIYEFRKFIRLLSVGNPNVIMTLFLSKDFFLISSSEWEELVENRDFFLSKKIYKSFVGYAYSQLKRMESYSTKGYMGEKRKELVNKYGYDTKNASHCIRLLRMGAEFFKTGEMSVTRNDADELLAIKKGKYKLSKIKKMAEEEFSILDYWGEKSKLPDDVDIDKISKLCCNILSNYFRSYNERETI